MSGTIPQLSCWLLQGSVLLVPLRIWCQKWGHVFPQWHCMLCCTSCAPALSHSLHQALAAVSIVLLSSLNTISTPLWGNGYRSWRFLWSDVSCADQDVWKQLAGAVFLGTGFGYKRARTCLEKTNGKPPVVITEAGLTRTVQQFFERVQKCVRNKTAWSLMSSTPNNGYVTQGRAFVWDFQLQERQ